MASGVMSVNSSPTVIGDRGEEKAAGVGLEQFAVKSSNGLLVPEGVDEDGGGLRWYHARPAHNVGVRRSDIERRA